MEAEVVQMCVNMFKGGKDACGTVMTSKLLFLSPLVTFCQRNYIIILYLLVYNACLCIKHIPILGCTLKKRIIIIASSRKHRKCLRKTRIEKSYFVYTLKDVSLSLRKCHSMHHLSVSSSTCVQVCIKCLVIRPEANLANFSRERNVRNHDKHVLK